MTFRTFTAPEAKLSQSLEAGFWSPDLRARPAVRPQRCTSRVRLNPLGSSAPTAPTCSDEATAEEYLPSPVARAPSVGHVGRLWGMRHSAPSSLELSQCSVQGARRMAELATSSLSCSDLAQSCSLPSRRAHMDVRSRRVRRPADFGASSCLQRRSHSCVGVAEDRAQPAATFEGSAASRGESKMMGAAAASSRCCSTPPTGTTKADDSAGMAAKAKAVATLQRLFFEEMAKNGQDASGAAARALLRLSEAPPPPAAALQHESSISTGREVLRPDLTSRPASDDDDAPDAVEEAPRRQLPEDATRRVNSELEQLVTPLSSQPTMPRRPAAIEGRRKRPCPAPRIKVGA